MKTFYNTATFERRAYEDGVDTSKYLPSGFISYAVGQEPQELLDAIAYNSPAQLEAEAKATKQTALANITVTTTNGNTFDGDDTARSDMMSAITSADTLAMTETSWKLSDNSWATVDIAEMREALALSIQAKGSILNG